jgi:hypothetical protein
MKAFAIITLLCLVGCKTTRERETVTISLPRVIYSD